MTRRGPLFAFIVVLAAVAFSATRGLDRGMPCHYSYHQDEIAPLRALGFLERYTDPVAGVVDKYTPAAYLYFAIPARIALELRGDEQAEALLALARERGPRAWDHQFEPSVWREMERFAPALSDCIVAFRLAAGFANVLVALGAGLLAWRLFAPWTGVLAALACGLSPYVVYYGHTANNDGPAFAFLMLGLAALAFLDSRRPVLAAAGAGIALALASAIKDQIAILVAFTPFALLALDFVRTRRGERALTDLTSRIVGCVAFVATYAVAANLVFDFAGYRAHAEFGMSQGITEQYMMADPYTADGLLHLAIYTATYFVRSNGALGAVVMLVGLIFALRRRRDLVLLWLVPAAIYFVLYPLRRGVIYPRFLVPCFLPLLLLGCAALFEWVKADGRLRIVGWFGVLAIGAIAQRGFTVNRLWERDPRVAAAEWIAANVPSSASILYVGNHAVPPPRPRSDAPRRWAHAADLKTAFAEVRPRVVARMMSTHIGLVVRPGYPWPISAAEREALQIVAEFGRDLYEPELLHPILADIDALPGVLIIRGE
jgi:hypothetical protein